MVFSCATFIFARISTHVCYLQCATLNKTQISVGGDGEDARLKPNDMIICVNNKKGKRG